MYFDAYYIILLYYIHNVLCDWHNIKDTYYRTAFASGALSPLRTV